MTIKRNAMEELVYNREPLENEDYMGKEIRLCTDGKYRWVYKMHMLKNPTIFLTVFKIFAYIVVVGFLIFGFFLYVIHGDWEGLWGMAKAMGLVLLIFLGLTFLGVALVAALYGGKYEVLFVMDEKEIAHIQVPQQFRKAQKLAAVTAMAGAAGGSFTAAGAGMLAATKNASISVFAHVKRVKARRWLHVIKVNQLFDHNHVYVQKEDFDFVYNFIKSHCPNAK
jgi:hypothetical protein